MIHMKEQLKNTNVLFVLTSFLSRQNKLSNYHTKTHFIKQLRNRGDFVAATYTHASFLKAGLLNDTITTNHLINCYVRHRKLGDAHKLFEEMPNPNVVSWTSLMAGYIDMGRPKMALWLFGGIYEGLGLPNEFTFATVINACSILAELKTGRKIHAFVEIMGFQFNIVVSSSLIDMYGKCEDVEGARRVFDLMECRNVVSWTSMIAAYAQNAKGDEALEIFREFNTKMVDCPNEFMFASVIGSCASLGRLVSGKVTHGAVIRRGHDSNDVVASALVDMYAKCGCANYSEKVFWRIPNPSVIAFTSMIVGAANYGLGTLSLKLFGEMIHRRIKPNDVTFIGVLHACSHSGLVDEGIEHLNSMYRKHAVMPTAKHYTCVVDMLGRTGRLDEAYQLAKTINVEPDAGALLWGTLLSASRLHGRVDIAAEACKWLIESNQQVPGAYVTLSNTYALAGNWKKCQSLRSELKRIGACKEPGRSWIEIKY